MATTGATPTVTGTAGNAVGDSTTVTVKIYNGAGTGGTVAQMIPVTRTGTNWTTAAAPLASGTYTVQATQSDLAGNTGSSSAVTFTVDATAPSLTTVQFFDTDQDGKIDQIKATFDKSLATYSAGTAPWTLSGAPAGTTVAAVSATGTVATLTLNEGAVDTAATGMKLALTANANGIGDSARQSVVFHGHPRRRQSRARAHECHGHECCNGRKDGVRRHTQRYV